MGAVLNAFRRKRAQLYVPRPVKPGCQTPVIIEKPVRSLGRFLAKLPADEKLKMKKFARIAGRLPRHLIEFGYHRFERVTRYANYGTG